MRTLPSSKTKQACETSSKMESSQHQNDEIQRDNIDFWSWQHQKRSKSARLFQKMKVHSDEIQRDFIILWSWQHWKRSRSARLFQKWKFTAPKWRNSARIPQFLKSTTLKTKQACETFQKNESSWLQNDEVQRDFIASWKWRQKWSNSARHPAKMESWVQSWRPRTNAFCDFSVPSL